MDENRIISLTRFGRNLLRPDSWILNVERTLSVFWLRFSSEVLFTSFGTNISLECLHSLRKSINSNIGKHSVRVCKGNTSKSFHLAKINQVSAECYANEAELQINSDYFRLIPQQWGQLNSTLINKSSLRLTQRCEAKIKID